MTAPTVEDTTTDDPNNQEYTGGFIGLIPADPYPHALAVPGGLPPDQLHLTLCYLGDDVTDWDPELRGAVLQCVRRIAGDAPLDDDDPVPAAGPWVEHPLTLQVFAHSHFNPTGADGREPCMVYQFQGDDDLAAVEGLASEVRSMVRSEIGDVNFPEQHARFEPHVTAGYGLDPDALTYVGPVVFDRIRIALADRTIDIPLGTGGTVTAAAPTAPTTTKVPTAPDAPPPVVISDTGDTITVHWPALAIEGMDTGDGRYLQPGGGSHRSLPLSLLGLPYKSHGGEQAPPAQVFGKITDLQYRPGPEVQRANGEPFPEGTFVWSADAEIDGTHEFAELVRKGYLRGGSIDIGELNAELIDEEDAAMSDHPNRHAIFHNYEIAAATMVPVPAFADAYCEVADALPQAVAASGLPADINTDPAPMVRVLDLDDPTCWEDLETMTAAAALTTELPPAEWFHYPEPDHPCPLTVTDDGQVYGHLALWNTSHISYPHRRVTPPRSATDYAYFHTGSVKVLDNGAPTLIPAGHIALDTGHASMTADAAAASAHYDNTGTIVADVRVIDGKLGPWVAGATTPGLDELKLHKLRSCGLSGDWRRIGAGLELVAAISVPTPGFPVPRARVASGQPMALVAAGALLPEPRTGGTMTLDYDVLADALAERLDQRARHRQVMTTKRDALLAELTVVPDGRVMMDALLAELDDDQASFEVLGFDKLVARLVAEGHSEESAKKIAAKIGRRKYGPAKMAAKAAAGARKSMSDLEDGGVDVEAMLLAFAVTDQDLADADEYLTAMKRQNWVSKAGGLPSYIKRIKKHLEEKGMTESHAIAVAKNAAQKMCDTGDVNFPGKQNVNAGSRAEACAAVADWNRKRVQGRG